MSRPEEKQSLKIFLICVQFDNRFVSVILILYPEDPDSMDKIKVKIK